MVGPAPGAHAQRYGVPHRGLTFAVSDELTLVRQRESLFPQLS